MFLKYDLVSLSDSVLRERTERLCESILIKGRDQVPGTSFPCVEAERVFMGAMMGLVCSEEVVFVRHEVSKVI